MKKLFFVTILLGGVIALSAFADKIAYQIPVQVDSIGFKAEVKGYSVVFSWKKYLRNDLQSYVLVRSATHSDPFFPEDGAVFATVDRNVTAVADMNAKPGRWYYRLCILTKDGYRWVSPVVTLTYLPPPTHQDFSN